MIVEIASVISEPDCETGNEEAGMPGATLIAGEGLLAKARQEENTTIIRRIRGESILVFRPHGPSANLPGGRNSTHYRNQTFFQREQGPVYRSLKDRIPGIDMVGILSPGLHVNRLTESPDTRRGRSADMFSREAQDCPCE